MKIDKISEKYGVSALKFEMFLGNEADRLGIKLSGFFKDNVADEDVERAVKEFKIYEENTPSVKLKKQKEEELLRQKQAEEERAQKAVDEAGGYWEYKVLSLVDEDSGAIIPNQLEAAINSLGSRGWHLRCAYTNELGRNSNSSGAFGSYSGTNATIDQNVLIFERFVRQ